MTTSTTLSVRLLRSAAVLAAFFALAQPGYTQPRPPAAVQQTMDIGDEPGRVSTEEVSITEGPYARQMVLFRSNEAPGTVVIHSAERFLYVVQGNGRALRYGIGVGREGFQWSGLVQVSRKAEWPDWRPPPEMLQRQPYLPRFMAGGPLESLATDADAVAERPVVAHHHIKKALGGVDHHGVARLAGAEEHHLAGVGTILDHRFGRGDTAGLIADVHGLRRRRASLGQPLGREQAGQKSRKDGSAHHHLHLT
jgi:hypothetical protein